jgi:putative aminopeptidase FrvX
MKTESVIASAPERPSGKNRIPRIRNEQLRLLERLCNACAVSGDEGEVRSIVLEKIRPFVDQLKVDALGNVLATRLGRGENRLRLMVAAHMDEVGVMLISDEENGVFRFDTVGGLDSNQLVGKPLWVGSKHVPGVIGIKPIHLSEDDELHKPVSLDALRIDVGSENGKKVKVGDRAVFATAFNRLGPSIRAKALDNRLGVATLIELVRQPMPHLDLMAAFTVQEEVGLRGAHVAAYALNPDLAFVLDSTPARDFPTWESGGYHTEPGGSENTQYNTRLDSGPAIYVADNATLSDPRLIRYLVETAEKYGIPYQIRQPGGGGTDAGTIHLQREGIPTISISVPGRYLHTAASIARIEDWRKTQALVQAALANLSPDILKADR